MLQVAERVHERVWIRLEEFFLDTCYVMRIQLFI